MRYAIRTKSGTSRQDASGAAVYATTLEYSGEWMGSCALTISVRSAYPIPFGIDDYVEYRGERFVLRNVPSVVKNARLGSYGAAFVYDGMKFQSLSGELLDVRFRDVVLGDNGLHYSSLPNFTYYADSVDDYADRLQANLDEWCLDNGMTEQERWRVFTPRELRSLSRGITAEEYAQAYGSPAEYDVSGEKFAQKIDVSDATAWSSLKVVKDNFGLNFVVRGRWIIIGGKGVEADHLFEYGKGNGLYEMQRVADSDQQVVTKLYAYGSDKNMPIRYYANLNVVCYATVTSIPRNRKNEDGWQLQFEVDMPFDEYDWTERMMWRGEVLEGWKVGIRIGEVSLNSWVMTPGNYVATEGHTRFIVQKNTGTDEWSKFFTTEEDETLIESLMSSIAVGDKVYFERGARRDAIPEEHKERPTDNMPNNMAVNCLMLPGFPLHALSDLVRCSYDAAEDKTTFEVRRDPYSAWGELMVVDGRHLLRFSSDRHNPYIVSGNVDALGVKEGCISFTEDTDDNGLKAIYPSIEGLTEADIISGGSASERIDEVAAAKTIDDNGVYGEGDMSPQNFTVTLKGLGFDLHDAFVSAGSNAVLSMKDGYCGGRDFQIKVVSAETRQEGSAIVKTGRWLCWVSRNHDDLLDLYFPYSYNKSIGREAVADEPYQIRAGDHFVLTGLYMEDTSYVWAASVKMLRKSILWLIANDYTRYTYTPKVDEIYLAREHDAATAAGRASVFTQLKEGHILHFRDVDLDIEGKIYIDTLRIKEQGNSFLPTVEVVLRNDKSVGTLQQVQDKVNNLGSLLSSGGGGLSTAQVGKIVGDVGRGFFVSKTADDVALGNVRFVGGVKTGEYERHVSGASIGAAGDAEFADIVLRSAIHSPVFNSGFGGQGFKIWQDGGEWYAEVDGLTVRGTFRVYELLVRRIRSIGGQLLVSPASGTVAAAERVDLTQKGAVIDGWKITLDEGRDAGFAAGDLVLCQQWTGAAVKRYWCNVIEVGTDGSLYINHKDSELLIQNDDVWENCTEPLVGDHIVTCGALSNTDRQSAILIDAIGHPKLSMYDGISARTFAGALKTRLGYLGDVNDPHFGALKGHGLYGSNVYLKGKFKLVNESGAVMDIDDSVKLMLGQNGIVIDEDGVKLVGGKVEFVDAAQKPYIKVGNDPQQGTYFQFGYEDDNGNWIATYDLGWQGLSKLVEDAHARSWKHLYMIGGFATGDTAVARDIWMGTGSFDAYKYNQAYIANDSSIMWLPAGSDGYNATYWVGNTETQDGLPGTDSVPDVFSSDPDVAEWYFGDYTANQSGNVRTYNVYSLANVDGIGGVVTAVKRLCIEQEGTGASAVFTIYEEGQSPVEGGSTYTF